jgi:hypothetical protein
MSILLLQSKTSDAFSKTVLDTTAGPGGGQYKTVRYAGRTLDLSLFTIVRALDAVVGELWARRKAGRLAAEKWTASEALISRFTDSAVFAVSTGLVLWMWIYNPTRLPPAYQKWITAAAEVDERLLEALRRCRKGEIVYGKDTGQAHLLGDMCADLNLPVQWGDPAVTIGYPCDIVHMGRGPSCEYHAVVRFLRCFKFAAATYVPLNLLMVVRRPSFKSLVRAFYSAARSSAFLSGCVTLFYYGVCLARSRIGPRVLGTTPAARQRIDSGVCVASGCFFCGWPILIEKAGRRKDMALFVAPRALAALLPRRYPLDKQWRETFLFALSTAVLFTCVHENKKRVRGVLGSVLHSILVP